MGVADRSLVVWLGRLASALVVMILLADAAVAIIKPETMRVEMETTGFPMNLSILLDLVMLGCAVVYAIPQTATLGAILVTGFLGGAICTHFRLGEIGCPYRELHPATFMVKSAQDRARERCLKYS